MSICVILRSIATKSFDFIRMVPEMVSEVEPNLIGRDSSLRSE